MRFRQLDKFDYNVDMISCILLAAGLSSRFGSPKALSSLQGKPIIERIQRVIIDSHVSELIVVLGAFAEEIKPFLLKHKKINVVYNKDFHLGQTSSFKSGLRTLSDDIEGIMLLPVDYPLIKKEILDCLAEEFSKTKPLVLIPTYQGKKGHPPIFNNCLKEKLLKLDDSLGVNTITGLYANRIKFLDVSDSGIIKTFNTREEFVHLKREWVRQENELI